MEGSRTLRPLGNKNVYGTLTLNFDITNRNPNRVLLSCVVIETIYFRNFSFFLAGIDMEIYEGEFFKIFFDLLLILLVSQQVQC